MDKDIEKTFIESRSNSTGCSANNVRKPEYHLYLYEVLCRPMLFTVEQVNQAVSMGHDVGTIQVCTLSTSLFTKGYRIFVHDKPDSKFEITLGKCERTNREIRMGHNLEKMLLSGEFDSQCTSE